MQSLIVGKASLRIKFFFPTNFVFPFCSCILNFTFFVKKKSLCLRLIYNNAILAATVNRKKVQKTNILFLEKNVSFTAMPTLILFLRLATCNTVFFSYLPGFLVHILLIHVHFHHMIILSPSSDLNS